MGPGLTGHVSIHSQQLVYTPTDKEGHRRRAPLREVATFTRLIDFCTAQQEDEPLRRHLPLSSTTHFPSSSNTHFHFLILSSYLLFLPSDMMAANGTFTKRKKKKSKPHSSILQIPVHTSHCFISNCVLCAKW